MVGKVYKRLTILERVGKLRPTKVIAKCECGIIKEYFLGNISQGKTNSCGCFQKQRMREVKTIKHGYAYHPLQHVWQGMKERCYNEKCKVYHSYGGRGIIMCAEWRNSIGAFCEWGMINGYAKGLELDRENNNGNYEPSNCRFITPAQNSRNRRSNIWITYNNKTMILKDWATELGINYKSLHKKMKYKGKTFEQAIAR